jgi:glycerol-3-phosphate dehydrogenase (NAD(P)+)
VVTAPTIREQAIKTGLDMPIMEQVYQVLAEGKSPKSAVLDLMQRVPRDE